MKTSNGSMDNPSEIDKTLDIVEYISTRIDSIIINEINNNKNIRFRLILLL